MIFNYENVESMKNLINISFLKEDINQILSSNDLNKKFRKIMSMYDVMIGKSNKVINIDEVNQETFKPTNDIKIFEDQDGINNGKSKTDSFILAKDKIKKNPEQSCEIKIKVKIEQKDINKTIYFLDDAHGSDKKEFNEDNTTLIIDGKITPFKNCFIIPSICRIYLIKLIINSKISNCSRMFYQCENIVEIDFSKFNTKNVTKMQEMFYGCSGLKSLDL